MAEEITRKEYNSDVVEVEVSDGENTIVLDIAAAANPIPTNADYSIEDFESQKIKQKVVKNTNGKDSVEMTITYDEEEFDQFQAWNDNTTKLTYKVTGLSTAPKSFENVIVRISATPEVAPGVIGVKTYGVTFSFVGNYKPTAQTGA